MARLPRRSSGLMIVLAAASVQISGVTAASADPAPLDPGEGALFGAYVQPQDGWTQAKVKAAVTGLETQIGRKLDIDQEFYQWGQAFPMWQEAWDIQEGRTPLINWNSTYTSEINTGQHDAYISARADGLKALQAPVFLRWFAEMEFGPRADKAGTPEQYIAAWRRIHGIFESRGATNVVWVWTPTAWGFKTGDAQKFYPGDAYVDWIGADGYNWAPVRPGASWITFEFIFAGLYSWAAPKGKPLMVAETGVTERNPGEKAQWIREMRNTLKTRYPAIRAVVYFSARAVEPSGTYDWRVNTSADSLAAYGDMAQDAHFGGTGEDLPDAPTVPAPQPPQAAPLPQAPLVADAAIRKAGQTAYLGTGLLDPTGQTQTARTSARRGAKRDFVVRIKNVSTSPSSMIVQGPGSGRRTSVRYRVDGQDVTSLVTSGGLTFQNLAPGQTRDLLVSVMRRRAPLGSASRVRIRVSSSSLPGVVDVVNAYLRLRR